MQRLGFRHRVAQAGHLFGWTLSGERRGVPQMEHDMKENRAQDLEKNASDFLRFVTGPPPVPPASPTSEMPAVLVGARSQTEGSPKRFSPGPVRGSLSCRAPSAAPRASHQTRSNRRDVPPARRDGESQGAA